MVKIQYFGLLVQWEVVHAIAEEKKVKRKLLFKKKGNGFGSQSQENICNISIYNNHVYSAKSSAQMGFLG